MKKYLLILSITSFSFAQPGILNIGFDIDDTVLYSEVNFQTYIKENGYPVNYGWINQNDKNFSFPITPTFDLIHFFRSKGHNVFYITARPGTNGEDLAKFLTKELGYKVEKDVDLFFMPKERIGDNRFTTKHKKMKELGLDLFYGDSDTDIIAALKAGVQKNNETISKECIQMVRDKVGPVAAFKTAIVVKRLPKTRSGKILRGTVRKIADKEDYKMPATIDDPAILKEIKEDLIKNGILK